MSGLAAFDQEIKVCATSSGMKQSENGENYLLRNATQC